MLSKAEYNDPKLRAKLKSSGWRLNKSKSADGSDSFEAVLEEFNEQQIRQEIIHNHLRPTIPKESGPFFANLIPKLWRKDPKERLSAQEVMVLIESECKKEGFEVPEVANIDDESEEEIQVVDRTAPTLRRCTGRTHILLERKNGDNTAEKGTNNGKAEPKKMTLVELKDIEQSVELVPTRSETLSTILPQLHAGMEGISVLLMWISYC